jgi:purine-binding chemotaxis protein CheW
MASYIKPVVFSLNGHLFGVDISLILSIEKQVKVVRIPNESPCVEGIINLRGDIIPLYDLKKKFTFAGDSTNPDDKSIIVIRTKDTKLAITVDSVLHIGDVESANISEMPELAKKPGEEVFDRVANINGKLVVLLNVDAILSKEELSDIEKVKEAANKEVENEQD